MLTLRANELEAANQRISEILDSIQDPFYTVDGEWRLTYVNQKAELFWGIEQKDLIGRTVWDVFPEAMGSDSYHQIQRAMKERQSCHYETISPIGNTWIEVHVYPTRDGGLTVYFRDINDRKKVEKALRESEERFNKAFDASPVGLVISLKENGQIQEVNKSFERIFGYRREDVIGKNSIDLGMFVNPSDRREAVHRLDLEGSVCDFELEIRTKSGEVRQASLSISPIVVDNHDFILTSIQDITERKQAESELHDRSDRLAFLSEAAGELLRGSDPIILMERIFTRLSVLVDLDIYFHYLVSPDQSHLELTAFSGLPVEDRLQFESLEFGQAICGQTALTQQPALAENIQNSAEERTNILRQLGINSYVCYPLISWEHLIETLSFGSRRHIISQKNHFTCSKRCVTFLLPHLNASGEKRS